ncbi:MAG: FHA domain-containing protein [Magnetococcus sp. YQC-9]
MTTMLRARLIVYQDGELLQEYPVGKEPINIGRAKDNDIRLSDEAISRHHLRVMRNHGEKYSVRDLASKNGTYLNNERIQEERLKNGDRIDLGRFSLLFSLTPKSASGTTTKTRSLNTSSGW